MKRRLLVAVAVSGVLCVSAGLAVADSSDPGAAPPSSPSAAAPTETSTPAERDQSETQYMSDDSPAQANAVATGEFGEMVDSPVLDANHPTPTTSLYTGGSDQDGLLSANQEIVRDSKTKQREVVQSTAQLDMPDGNGDGGRLPIDLSLHPVGGEIEPLRTSTPIDISQQSGRVDFPDQGFSVGMDNVSPSASTSTTDDTHTMTSDVATDTDWSVHPEPTGVESFIQIRSKDSPETFRLAVSMPDGAHLERSSDVVDSTLGSLIPGDPPKTFAIVKDGDPIGYVSPPQTVDADNKAVPTTSDIDGQDIVVNVQHKDADVHYPLLTDPQFYVQSGGCNNNFAGWYWKENTQFGSSTGSHFGQATCDSRYAPGLYESMSTNTFYGFGEYANFLYQAPASSYIYGVTFGNVAHNGVYGYDNFFSGIENGSFYSNVSAYNAAKNLTLGNPFQANYQFSGQILDTCFNPRCYSPPDNNTAPPGNEGDAAALGIQPLNQNNKGVTYTAGYNPNVTMGYANVSLGDQHAPTITSTIPSNVGWNDDNAASHRVNISAADIGLGVHGMAFGINGVQQPQHLASCSTSPGAGVAPCPATYNTYFDYTEPEGVNNLTFQGDDIVGNKTTPNVNWTDKIDRGKPKVDFSNTLATKASKEVYGDSLPLTVTATDGSTASDTTRRSGVTSLTVSVTDSAGNKQTLASSSPGCSTDSCSITLTPNVDLTTLEAGTASVTATATDAVGHTGTNSLPFTVSDVDPLVSEDEMVQRSVDFRDLYGLSTDTGLITSLLEDPSYDASRNTYGVPLTATEAQEVERQDLPATDDPNDDVDSEAKAEAGGDYAGSYSDNGLLHVLYTKNADAHLAALKAQFAHPEILQAGTVAVSADTLASVQSAVDSRADDLASQGVELESTGIDFERNVVTVGVNVLDANATNVLNSYFGGQPVSYLQESNEALSGPQYVRDRFRSPIDAGLRIRPLGGPIGYCTAAFSAHDGPNLQPVIYTAAHCTTDPAQQWLQGGTVFGRPYKIVGGGDADAAELTTNRTPGPNGGNVSASIFISPKKSQTISDFETEAGGHEGDRVCQSGGTSGFRCGRLAGKDFNVRVYDHSRHYLFTVSKQRGFYTSRLGQRTDPCQPGDSGGPVFTGSRAKGIVSSVGKHPTGSKALCYYTNIAEAQAALTRAPPIG